MTSFAQRCRLIRLSETADPRVLRNSFDKFRKLHIGCKPASLSILSAASTPRDKRVSVGAPALSRLVAGEETRFQQRFRLSCSSRTSLNKRASLSYLHRSTMSDISITSYRSYRKEASQAACEVSAPSFFSIRSRNVARASSSFVSSRAGQSPSDYSRATEFLTVDRSQARNEAKASFVAQPFDPHKRDDLLLSSE